MPRIRLLARGVSPVLEVAEGATLLAAIDAAGLPIGRSCGGEGVCRSCVVRTVQGGEHLAPPGPIELRARARGLDPAERLACQARVAAGLPPGACVDLWCASWGAPAPEGAPGPPRGPTAAI